MDDKTEKGEHDTQKLMRLMSYISLDPGNASLLLDALTLATELQDWEQARTLLIHCDATTEKDATLCAVAGYTYLCLGDYGKASDLLSEAIAQGVTDNDVIYNQAFSYMMQRKTKEALAALNSLDETYASTHSPLVLRARLMLLESQYDDAISILETVNGKGNVSAESAGLVAIAAYEEGKGTTIVGEWVERALALDPYNHEGLVAKSALLMDQRDFAEARRVLQSIVQHHPKSGRGWIGIAQLEFADLHFDKALEAADEAVKYNPEHIGSLHLVGWSHLMRGELDSALEAFDKSYELDRNFGETHAALASVYALQKALPKAKKHLKLAEKLNRDAFGVVFARMLLLDDEGQHDQVKALFESAKGKAYPALGGATPAQLVEQHLRNMIRTQK